MRYQRLLNIGLGITLGLAVATSNAAPTRNIYIVAGPSSIYHAPIGHDYYPSSQIWTNRLTQRGHNLKVTLLQGWPSNPATFTNADAIVLYSEGGCNHEDGAVFHEIMRNGRWDKAMQVINRGVSFGTVHYAIEPSGAPQNWPGLGSSSGQYGTNEFVQWLGGYYVGWYSTAHSPSWNSTLKANLSFPSHPLNPGNISYSGATFDDEWYANIYFGQTVQPFVQLDNHPNGGGVQTVAWTRNRDDGARGFSWTGGHYTPGDWASSADTYSNMDLMLNAIEWIGKVGVDDHSEVMIPSSSTWKYDTDGSMDANWNTTGFNDGGWSSGTAPLGYDDWGQDWIGTTVSAGSSGNRPITTWFRKSFNVPTLNNVTNFLVKLNADDGAVVYLNGTEIGRYNMPGGTITASTTASNSAEVNWTTTFDTACPYNQSQWDAADQNQRNAWSAEFNARNVAMTNSSTPEFYWGRILGGSALVQGNNVLAIEVHQRDTSNPDMRLDVEASLLGNNSFIPGDTSSTTSAPTVSANAATLVTANSATLNGSVNSTGLAPTQVSIVWGTADAGTALGSWQHVVSLGFQPATAVSTAISGLTGATPYFYRVYASNVAGTAWSSATTFSTKVGSFTAYNDVAWITGQPTNKITLFGVDGSTGSLIDYTTGIGLDAQVTMSGVNASLWPGTSAGYAPAGTPAAQMLPTNIVDSVIHYYFDSATATFTGLVPTNFYTFVLYANRDGGYTDRYTTVEIQGADSFTNNSTVGAVSQTSTTTTIFTGSSHGNVFRYDRVNPGSDGTVVFQLTGYKPCLNSFMVQTPSTNVASTNTPPPAGGPTNLIALGTSWQYFNTNSGPATNWTTKAFSDGSWPSGPAPLGYADPAIMTTLSFGGVDTNKWVTYYFRKHFVITNAASITGLVASFIADDGAVVYLNGAKVYTSTNMIEPVSNTSMTTDAEPEPYVPTQFTIAPSGVTTGDNVMAVEVHQATLGSSDLYFDMSLNTVGFATTNQVGGGQGASSNPPPPSVSNWTAYVDTAWHQDANLFGGQGIDVAASTFTTNSPIGPVNGALKATTGETLPVTMSFSGNATVGMLARDLAIPGGTDVATVFAGKIGTNNAANWALGTVTMTLSGLTTTKQYTVAIWSSRGGTSAAYSNRWTDITIKSVDSFANNSSIGLTKLTSTMANDETRVVAVIDSGRIARYDQVRPGADGTVVFDLTANGLAGSAETNGYLNAVMITESDVTGGGTPGDTDSDGMPDTWEQSFFGGTSATNGGMYQDADGDGLLNIEEFIAGTSPTSGSSGPMLDHTALTNGLVKFDMATTTGRLYFIDFRSNMTSSAWQNYTSFTGNGSSIAVTNTRLDPRLYYRFRVRMENP